MRICSCCACECFVSLPIVYAAVAFAASATADVVADVIDAAVVVEAIFAAVVVVASMQDIILSIFSHEEGKQEAFFDLSA